MFLNLNIGQVAFKVKDVLCVIRFMGKSGESLSIKPNRQLAVICTENINSQIELFPSEK